MTKKLSDDIELRVIALYQADLSGSDIAAELGISSCSVYNILKRNGLKPRKSAETWKLRAAFRPTRKAVDDVTAEKIIFDYVVGRRSAAKIAAKHGLSDGQVAHTLERHQIRRRSYSDARRVYEHNGHAFDNAENSEVSAYFVGLLMADGCVGQAGPYSNYVSLSLYGDDAEHVLAFRDFLSPTAPVGKVLPRENFPGHPSAGGINFRVASPRLFTALARYGVVPRKSMSAKVSVLERNRHFWRGMVDGDGHVTTSSRGQPVIGFTGGEGICLQYSEFIRGVSSAKGNLTRNNTIWEVRVKCAPAVEIIRHLYDPCEIALPRKLRNAREILARQ